MTSARARAFARLYNLPPFQRGLNRSLFLNNLLFFGLFLRCCYHRSPTEETRFSVFAICDYTLAALPTMEAKNGNDITWQFMRASPGGSSRKEMKTLQRRQIRVWRAMAWRRHQFRTAGLRPPIACAEGVVNWLAPVMVTPIVWIALPAAAGALAGGAIALCGPAIAQEMDRAVSLAVTVWRR